MNSSDLAFAGLPTVNSGIESRSRRIAIASIDIAGPYHCGGVGAAYQGLAQALAGAGHEVTVLYLHHGFHHGDLGEWTRYFHARGIRFVHLPPAATGNRVWYANRKEVSLHCYHWLRGQLAFDVVHFHEWLGLPFYSLVAKRDGIAFENTTLCVGTHGPMRWSRQGDETLVSRTEDLVVDFMERKSVEWADVVVSPSQYLLGWMRDDGWILPERSYVAANILEPLGESGNSRPRPDTAIRELVFFGRLDRRKGLPFFCDVLDRLSPSCDFAVTFLGSSNVVVDGRSADDYLRGRSAGWKFTPSLLDSFSRVQALEYLSCPGRLALIPSQVDNSPCTVQECLQEGIPFLASDRGGIPELVHPDDLARVTSPLRVPRFAARLQEILERGQEAARPAEPLNASRERWLGWHAASAGASAPPAKTLGEQRLMSVCVAHYERPRQLEQMLESLRRQSESKFEVVLVDDGSPSEDARSYLRGLEDEFAARHWQLIRQENAGPGIARDLAARSARGSLFLFADDDDVLLPHTVETFARVWDHTRADALTCVLAEFEGDDPPGPIRDADRLLIPLGPALTPGLIAPEFGGTLYLLTRECYFAAGGFSPERDVDEDWELTLQVVARGFDLRMIPEPLVWYRMNPMSRSRADNRFARNQSRLQVYEKLLPLELRDLAALAYARISNAPDVGSQRRLERVASTLEKLHKQRRAQQRVP